MCRSRLFTPHWVKVVHQVVVHSPLHSCSPSHSCSLFTSKVGLFTLQVKVVHRDLTHWSLPPVLVHPHLVLIWYINVLTMFLFQNHSYVSCTSLTFIHPTTGLLYPQKSFFFLYFSCNSLSYSLIFIYNFWKFLVGTVQGIAGFNQLRILFVNSFVLCWQDFVVLIHLIQLSKLGLSLSRANLCEWALLRLEK